MKFASLIATSALFAYTNAAIYDSDASDYTEEIDYSVVEGANTGSLVVETSQKNMDYAVADNELIYDVEERIESNAYD